ncbi:MAG: ATP-dependent helicase, partial [Candidatus Latescibacterota bacterium]
SLWVCGDDWQSIYAFTGASVGNLLGFRNMYPEAAVLTLSENYRSTPQILAACQNLMRHNTRKLDKPLVAVQPDGAPVKVLESYSEEDEAIVLAAEIEMLHERGCRYEDIGVLYRSNFQSRVIEECFLRLGIPYRSEQGMDFYRRAEVQALLEYLRCVLEPDSERGDRAFRIILDVPCRGLGKSFLRQLESVSKRQGVSLFRGLREMEIPNPRRKKGAEELFSIIESFSREAGSVPPAVLIGKLRQRLHYDRFFAEEEVPGPDDARIENINQLQLAATGFSSVEDFLDHADRLTRASEQGRRAGVRLLTVHRSKGLEFPVVFVAGMADGILPSEKGEIEEERRICFVAISRAKRALYLSYAHTIFGRLVRRSRFVDEILEQQEEKPAKPDHPDEVILCR